MAKGMKGYENQPDGGYTKSEYAAEGKTVVKHGGREGPLAHLLVVYPELHLDHHPRSLRACSEQDVRSNLQGRSESHRAVYRCEVVGQRACAGGVK